MNLVYRVRRMIATDVAEVARINDAVFTKKKDQESWIRKNLEHFPRMQYFVADGPTKLLGFILWVETSGHRPKPVVELEAMAVDPAFAGNGVGKRIVEESYAALNEYYRADRGQPISRVLIKTGEDNSRAQNLYRRTLGAEIEARIPDLYSGKTEVIMVARK